jgi:hypothetical protein
MSAMKINKVCYLDSTDDDKNATLKKRCMMVLPLLTNPSSSSGITTHSVMVGLKRPQGSKARDVTIGDIGIVMHHSLSAHFPAGYAFAFDNKTCDLYGIMLTTWPGKRTDQEFKTVHFRSDHMDMSSSDIMLPNAKCSKTMTLLCKHLPTLLAHLIQDYADNEGQLRAKAVFYTPWDDGPLLHLVLKAWGDALPWTSLEVSYLVATFGSIGLCAAKRLPTNKQLMQKTQL